MNDIDLFGDATLSSNLTSSGPALATLALEINAEHDAAENHARKAIEHARVAGDKLLLAKAQVEHGQWLPWLAANCPRLAVRTAQAYMRLADHWEMLAGKCATVAYLTINDALKLLNAPESDGDPATPSAFHDRIDAPSLPAPATVAAVAEMLAEFPEAERRAVLDHAAAATDLKLVRADAKYLHVSQARHEWYTPGGYIEAAREVMGGIDLDPASCEVAQDTVRATRYFDKEQDGLAQPWHGRVWLNPPFEAAVIKPFIAKLLADYRAGTVQQAIVLTDSATDTSWFHELANVARIVCFTKGRISFHSPSTDSQAPQRGQAFAYLGDRIDAFVARFREFGLVVEIRP